MSKVIDIGTSLLELGKLVKAIKHLQTAFEVAKKDPGSDYDDTTSCKLRLARKGMWNMQEEKRIQGEIHLQAYISIEDRDRKMNKLKKYSDSYNEIFDDIVKVEAELNGLIGGKKREV